MISRLRNDIALSGRLPCRGRQALQRGPPARAVGLPGGQADGERQALEADLQDVDLASGGGGMDVQGEPGGDAPAGVHALEGEEPVPRGDELQRPPPLAARLAALSYAPQGQRAPGTRLDLRLV